MASVLLGIRRILHPINGWSTQAPGAFAGLEFVGTNSADNWKTESPFYPKITPAAQKIVDTAVLQDGGVGFTWYSGGLGEYYGPKFQDANHKEYRHRFAVGPGVDQLRYGNIVIPGSAPQNPFGHPSGPQKPGLDMPLARGMAGGFFSAALRPGGSISAHFQSALSIEVNLPSFSDIRREFANQFAGPLRAFFDSTPPGPPAPPPLAPPGTEQYTIYVQGEDFSSPPPSGDNETYDPASGPQKPAGGSSEPFLESIDSSLKGISHQLSAIASAINRLKEPNTTEDEEKDAEKGGLLDLLTAGANILGSLMGLGTGVGDAAIGGAADLAKAAGGAALDALIDELGDLVDALIKGPEDEAVDGRFDKMADLFQYNGKSFTEYLSSINDNLLLISQNIINKDLKALLDGYFMDSEHGGREGVKPLGGGSGDVLVVGYGQPYDRDLDTIS